MLRSIRSSDSRRPAAAPSIPLDARGADQVLAERHPDLRMQYQYPAPARHAHDLLATDAKNYFPRGGVEHEIIGAMAPGGDHALFAHTQRDIGIELDRYYNLSTTMRRLFNYWMSDIRNGQRLLLCADGGIRPLTGEATLAAYKAGILLIPPRHAFDKAGDTYPSDQGPIRFDWPLYLLYSILRVVIGQALGDSHGHPRGADVEYANIVRKETDPASVPQLYCEPSPPVFPPWVQAPPAEETAIAHAPIVLEKLDRHLVVIQRYLDSKQPTDRLMLKGDREVMWDVIRAENSRVPDLNLTLHESVNEVFYVLSGRPMPFHRRVIFCDRKRSFHYVYADIVAHADRTLSVLLIEPAAIDSLLSLRLYKAFAARIRQLTQHPAVHVAAVSTGAQRTSADALTLCVGFAQAAHRHHVEILQMHPRQPISMTPAMARSPTTLTLKRMAIHSLPTRELPADFIKHAHSYQALRRHRDGRPQDIAGAMMLTRRMAMVPRNSFRRGDPYYPSAEYKRRSLIVGAILAYMPHDEPPEAGPS